MRCKNLNDQITQKNSKYGNILWKDLTKGLNVQRSPENHINID